METLILETRTRELIVSLVMDLRNAEMRLAVYRAILEQGEQHPEIWNNWRNLYEELVNSPDAAASERLAARLQPLLDFALRGLSQEDAQALLDRVSRMHNDIQ